MNVDTSHFTRKVTSWAEAKEIFTALGPDCIFRGQPNCDWNLSSSLERRILSKLPAVITPQDRLQLERLLLRSFRRAAHLYQSGSRLPANTLSWWAEMQHYGMATRLVDFTWSPYVASFFAFESEDRDCDRAIWALDDRFIGERVVGLIVREFGTEVELQKIYDTEIWDDQKFIDMFILEAQNRSLRMINFATPDRMNERMSTQQGLFVMPSTIDVGFMENLTTFLGVSVSRALIKIIIPNGFRVEILRDLNVMNITRASLFPGLEGYARAHLAKIELGQEANNIGLIEKQRRMRGILGLPE